MTFETVPQDSSRSGAPPLASRLPESVWSLLSRPDLQPLASDVTIRPSPGLGLAFSVLGPGQVLIDVPVDPGAGQGFSPSLIDLRHALELALLLRLWPDRPALAGLAAARTAALFAALEGQHGPLGSTGTEPEAMLAAWPRLRPHQSASAASLPSSTEADLRILWPLLGPAEWLMQTGGDVRLRVDPATGLNGYGCSHRPRPWAVTFASSTASSSSERGYAGAEAARRRVLTAALRGQDGVAAELEAIRRDLAGYYGLPPGSAVILAASGTDCELLALSLAQMHPAGRPVTNILIAPEETGTGVPLAAVGRHFAIDTARGEAVEKGSVIAGLREDTVLESVALRDNAGSLRPGDLVAAESADLVGHAVAQGRRVLLHLLDVSKTGLLAPSPDAVRAIEDRFPGAVDVVVDACQARITAERVRGYVDAGWVVLVTGSKFFTGPPFAGAVLVPPAIAGRLDEAELPEGLRAYCGRAEWPGVGCAGRLEEGGNLGLALRWQAALAEMRAFSALQPGERAARLESFIGRVRDAIVAAPRLDLIEVPPLRRAPGGEDWDAIGTILSFALRQPVQGGLLGVAEAREVYRWLNADLGSVLPPDLPVEERELGRRRFHVGQPVPLRGPAGEFAALRISVGARLVTGEPSHAHLGTEARLDREIGDALAVLEKVDLILRYFDHLRAANPTATFF